jgi:hypothetical protein
MIVCASRVFDDSKLDGMTAEEARALVDAPRGRAPYGVAHMKTSKTEIRSAIRKELVSAGLLDRKALSPDEQPQKVEAAVDRALGLTQTEKRRAGERRLPTHLTPTMAREMAAKAEKENGQ